MQVDIDEVYLVGRMVQNKKFSNQEAKLNIQSASHIPQ